MNANQAKNGLIQIFEDDLATENLPAGFPMITQAPATKVVEMGHNAVLLCGAVGSPAPIISWVRNMLPMDTSNPRFTVLDDEPGTAPRKVQVRPLSSSTMVIQWDEPETPNGQVTGYKVYYSMDPNQPMASWQHQMVDNSQLTTLSDLTPHTIYTIRVQALTSVGPGPLSPPIQIKTQQGVPSQPEMLSVVDVGETKVTLRWSKPAHSSENILSYELYWNDTYAKFELSFPESPIIEFYIVPGAPPRNVTGQAISPTSILVTWEPPPAERSNGRIAYYKLQVVESGRSDSEAKVIKLNQTKFVLDELKKWTEYRIWHLQEDDPGFEHS
ncbi:hypothetical protein M0802_005338 [Mischocyttarus mexicanus]|nr:hypothetical protein M0802_005338 [Mischocyttarus mexicanus]